MAVRRMVPLARCRSPGLPCWANGSVIGRARKPQLASRASFSNMAVPAAAALAWELQLLARPLGRRLTGLTAQHSAIRIGYCLSLTGPVAGNTRSARLAHDIWREDINGRGGLLGRPVELICYDDHADASLVPGIYKRLMDEDRVDLVIGGYGTNSLLPAMPLIMERQRFFVGLMGLGVNNALAYPNYFAMIPTGPDPNARSPRDSSLSPRNRRHDLQRWRCYQRMPNSPATRFLARRPIPRSTASVSSMRPPIR